MKEHQRQVLRNPEKQTGNAITPKTNIIGITELGLVQNDPQAHPRKS